LVTFLFELKSSRLVPFKDSAEQMTELVEIDDGEGAGEMLEENQTAVEERLQLPGLFHSSLEVMQSVRPDLLENRIVSDQGVVDQVAYGFDTVQLLPGMLIG